MQLKLKSNATLIQRDDCFVLIPDDNRPRQAFATLRHAGKFIRDNDGHLSVFTYYRSHPARRVYLPTK